MDILQMSISAALLIVAVVILRALKLYRLPKRTFFFLWGRRASAAADSVFNSVPFQLLYGGGHAAEESAAFTNASAAENRHSGRLSRPPRGNCRRAAVLARRRASPYWRLLWLCSAA